MHHEPDNPCRKSAPVRMERPLNLGNSRLTPDGCHVALIEVVERLIHPSAITSGVARGETANALRRIPSHLHRRLSDAGNLFAILFDMSQVATDENLRMAGRIEKLVHDDTTAAVCGEPKKLA